tara:strand:- start:19942 stop:20919 length:978 start_codon:yes stop_codon:yes gene_type:complete
MWIKRYFLQDEAGDQGSGGGGADTAVGGGGADTVAGGGGADTAAGAGGQDTVTGASGGQPTPIKFPENWREGLAAGDVKKIERLSRYSTPQAVSDALLAVQARIGAGELRSNVPFPEKGTDQEKAEWRKEQGLPETADKYDLKLKSGLVIGEEDKPRIDSFAKALHAKNAPGSVVSEAVNWYYDEIDRVTNERMELDKTQVQSTRDTLISEMGIPEFKANMNLVNSMLDTMPQAVRDLFSGGRLSDGSPILGGNPLVFKGLADWARKINPAGALVPGAGANTASAINDEIKKIETTMSENRAAYNKDAGMQKRYLELLEARESAK